MLLFGCFLILMGYLYTGNQLPLPSLHQEIISGLGWGSVSLAIYVRHITSHEPNTTRLNFTTLALFAVPALSVISSAIQYQYPYPSFVLLTVVSIGSAAMVAELGHHLTDSTNGRKMREFIYIAIISAGLINALIGIIQYMQIDVPHALISPLVLLGRSYGNIRQPNLYALLLAFSYLLFFIVYFTKNNHKKDKQKFWPLPVLITIVYSIGISTSGSRSGILFTGLIVLMSFIIPSLKSIRIYTASAFLLTILCWIGMIILDEKEILPFYSTIRTLPGHAETSDLSNSRFDLWKTAIYCIINNDGNGHGFHSVNKTILNTNLDAALTMASVSNVHNIFLQWALEYGSGWTVIWIIFISLWIYHIKDFYADFEKSLLFTAILLSGVHSLLELPMWHINFLLPTAFFIGIISKSKKSKINTSSEILKYKAIITASLMILSIHVFFDAQKLIPIYRNEKYSLVERIEKAYQTIWFTHWVDQAVLGTIFVTPANAKLHIALSKKVENFFLSPQVLLMLSLAYHYEGDDEKSQHFINIAKKSEPESINSFKNRIPQEQALLFEKLINK